MKPPRGSDVSPFQGFKAFGGAPTQGFASLPRGFALGFHMLAFQAKRGPLVLRRITWQSLFCRLPLGRRSCLARGFAHYSLETDGDADRVADHVEQVPHPVIAALELHLA